MIDCFLCQKKGIYGNWEIQLNLWQFFDAVWRDFNLLHTGITGTAYILFRVRACSVGGGRPRRFKLESSRYADEAKESTMTSRISKTIEPFALVHANLVTELR